MRSEVTGARPCGTCLALGSTLDLTEGDWRWSGAERCQSSSLAELCDHSGRFCLLSSVLALCKVLSVRGSS